jgi:signal peptidase II
VALAALSLAADRLSKSWVESELALGEDRSVIDGLLYLTHVRNPGAAFGLFADAGAELKAIVFGAAAALALAVVLMHLASLAPGDRRVAAALGLVAGGALGNLVDRLPQLGSGEVIDLLHFDLWGGYNWPDFNLADVAIVLGVAGLVVDMIARESASRAGRDTVDVDESRA